jgi:hypothetical protein
MPIVTKPLECKFQISNLSKENQKPLPYQNIYCPYDSMTKVERYNVVGEGNCWLRVLTVLFYGTHENLYMTGKQDLYREIKGNQEYYENFLEPNYYKSLEHNLQLDNCTWGGSREFQIFCNMKNICIAVHHIIPNWETRNCQGELFVPCDGNLNPMRTIHICFVNGNHYQILLGMSFFPIVIQGFKIDYASVHTYKTLTTTYGFVQNLGDFRDLGNAVISLQSEDERCPDKILATVIVNLCRNQQSS